MAVSGGQGNGQFGSGIILRDQPPAASYFPKSQGPVPPPVAAGAATRVLVPSDVSSLFAWWYAKDDASIDTTSSNVWTDHAAVGPALTQASAGLRGTENNAALHPYLSFDAVDDFLNVAGAPSGGWDAVSVITTHSSNATWRTLFWDTTNHHACLLESGTNRLGVYNSAYVDSGLTIAPSTMVVLVVRMDSSGNVSFSLNGGAFTATVSTFVSIDRAVATIGSSNPGGQGVGFIHDIALYSTNLSAANLDSVVGSRAWDWDLQGLLPVTHTYSAAPPVVAPGTTTNISPTTGHLTFSGKTPTVTLTVNVSPTTGHLTFGGKTPTVTKIFNISPTTGHLTLSGKTPTIAKGLLVTAGQIVFTPEPIAINAKTDMVVTAGQLHMNGQTVTVNAKKDLVYTAGLITFTGQTVNFFNVKDIPVTAAQILFTPEPITINAKTDLVVTKATITYSGQTVAIPLHVNIATGGVSFVTQSITINTNIPITYFTSGTMNRAKRKKRTAK